MKDIFHISIKSDVTNYYHSYVLDTVRKLMSKVTLSYQRCADLAQTIDLRFLNGLVQPFSHTN